MCSLQNKFKFIKFLLILCCGFVLSEISSTVQFGRSRFLNDNMIINKIFVIALTYSQVKGKFLEN